MGFIPSSGLAETIFKERYAFSENETWSEASRRVAESIGKDEPAAIREDFYNIINDGLLCPGGRIMYGAGRSSQGLLNCYVVPTEDSMAGWAKTVGDIMQISATGGGVGINFSPLRGRGEPISRGGRSTGAVSLMDMCDRIGDVLRSGGGRRVAMMHCLDVNHPDLNEFIHAKREEGRLNNANVSVVIPKDYDYSDLLDSGIFDEIVYGAINHGEPGILNSRLAQEMNPMQDSYDLISTNPCGEIWLPAYGVCCLGALVLPRFVQNGTLNLEMLKRAIKTSVRFLDAVLDQNDYPLPETQKMAQAERRLGLGVMGLHSMFMDMNVRYGSEASYSLADRVFEVMKQVAHRESQILAMEKDPFENWTPEAYPRVEGVGSGPRRNVALLTVAPTGTTSMLHEVTSGIEPMIAPAYIRRHWRGDDLVETLVVTKDYSEHGELAQGSADVTPEQHFRMQAVIQRHVDNAVSKTINLPRTATVEDIKDTWYRYLPVLKGMTLYREGSRENEPMTKIKIQDVPGLIKEWNGEIQIEVREETDNCASGVCAL